MAKMSPTDEAIEIFREAYELQMQGEVDEAIETYKRSLDLVPTCECHTFLGWAYSFQGRYRDAIDQCMKAIELDPDFGNPYNDIGVYMVELGRLDEAIPWLEGAKKAPRYDPRHYPSFNLGRVYVLKGMIVKAIEEFREAIDIEPGYGPASIALEKIESTLN